ncbi:uncharacterized protein LOC62_03G004855 [Vanrija pseudolonga]|uniref:C2H2-type domain-containing protein n=1 Tax=Vanrija pseudolonga TaxID=143232 RepID=A0AAF0Y769_9TREE|nr:hypothetical protein LOC62_03G004855 [Vanrija pseudolonga]
MAAHTCPFCDKEYHYMQPFMKHLYQTHPLSEAAESSNAFKSKKDKSDPKHGATNKTREEERRYIVKIAEASTGKSAEPNSSSFDEVVDLRSPSGSPSPSPPPTGWSSNQTGNDDPREQQSLLPQRRPAWATDGTTPAASPPAMKEKAAEGKGKAKERRHNLPDVPAKARGRGKNTPAVELPFLSDSDEDELESVTVRKFLSANPDLNKNSKRPSSPTLERNSLRSPKVIKLGRHANATEPARESELDRGDLLLSERAVSDLVRDKKAAEGSRPDPETSDSDSDDDSDEDDEAAEAGNSSFLPFVASLPSPDESDVSLVPSRSASPAGSSESEDDDDDKPVNDGKYDHAKAASVPNSVTNTPTPTPQRDQFERFMNHALRNKARAEGHPSVEPDKVASSSTLPSAPSPFASTTPAVQPKGKARATKHSAHEKNPQLTSTPFGAAPTPHNSSSPLVGQAALPTMPPPPQCDALACPSCHAMAHAFHVFHTTHSQWHCDAGP